MIEQLATSIRTKKTKLHHQFGIHKKPALDVWGGALKIETEGQPSTLKDLNLDAKNFTENWRNKNEWLQNKPKLLMIFSSSDVQDVVSSVWARLLNYGESNLDTTSNTSCRTQDWYSPCMCPVQALDGVRHRKNCFSIFSYLSSGARFVYVSPAAVFNSSLFWDKCTEGTPNTSKASGESMGKQQKHVYLVADGSY